MAEAVARFWMWLLWIGASALTIAALRAPSLSQPSGPSDFDVERAWSHVQWLARAPRPVGSAGHEAARRYVVDSLRALGLAVEIQEASSSAFLAGNTMSANLANVVGRLRGTDGTRRAVLLVAHYDSVEGSPGASDDGSGVATLLETARALSAGPRPTHDVLFLFTDAEELGMLGAQAFVAESPDRDDVAVALNFDARGSHGAVTMFATSPENGALIRALGRAVPRPVANSFIAALARLLPNDTDGSVFAAQGIPTCSFAYADGLEHYHHFSDSAQTLDPKSLAHAGSNALTFARALAAGDLDALRAPDRVYFDLFARVLVDYPVRVARWANAVLVLFLVLWVVRGARAGKLRWRALARASGRALCTVVIVSALTGLLGALVMQLLPYGQVAAHAKSLFIGEVAVALTALSSISARLDRRGVRTGRLATSPEESAAGAAMLWGLALALLGMAAPQASAPFFWPLLIALVAALAARWLTPRSAWSRLAMIGAETVALLPAWIMMTQIIYSALVATGATLPAIPAAFVGLLLTAMPRSAASRPRPERTRTLVSGAAVLMLALALARAANSNEPPPGNSLLFALDSDANLAHWLTFDTHPDSWVQQRIPLSAGATSLPSVTRWEPAVLASAAPAAPLPAPSINVDESGPPSAMRTVRLTIAAAPDVRCLDLWQEAGPAVTSVSVNRRATRRFVRFSPELDARLLRLLTADQNRAGWHLRHCGARGAPVAVELAIDGDAPVSLHLVEERSGLPNDPPLAPRLARSGPLQASDVTLCARRLLL